MINKLASIILFALLFGCATTSETQRPATTDGLTPLTSEEIMQTFTGKSFLDVSGNWTWDFQENGLAQAKAKDGEWETKDQKWSVENGKLCRSIKDQYPCVNIYKQGNTLYFGKTDSRDLETWAIAEI